MQTQEVHFTVTKQDFRAANYYIHLLLNKMLFFYISVGVLILFLIHMILVRTAVMEYWIPSGYIASVAVFWLLWQITLLERSISRYARSSASMLNAKSILRFTDTRMTFRIPERAFNSSGLFKEFPCAFETRHAFLVYTSGSDLFLIPLRAFKDTQKEQFRNILKETMGDRFNSRFNRHAPHIATEAEEKAEAYNQKKEAEKAAAKEAERAHKLAVAEAKKEGRDLIAEEEAAAEETAAVAGPNYRPHKNSIADRANLVSKRGKSVEKK
ncbi:MAG: YcxB family protein [Lachnospiraceae bacterium]|nr:YcxB family protein [Lachnospiraceae bacterium]